MAKEVDWVGPRALRLTNVLSFILGIGLSIPPSAVCDEALPALGLIPLFASALFSFALLKRKTSRLSAPAIFCLDVILAAPLLIVFVFTWLHWSQGWSGYNDNLVMLAAYGTVPMLVNFCIHALLALRMITIALVMPKKPQTCPRCATAIETSYSPLPWVQRTSGELTRILLYDDDASECRYQDHEHTEESAPRAKSENKNAGIQGQTSEAPETSNNARVMLS